jgi:hypothetical protein
MPTPPDVTHTNLRRHRPLPDREGILSPRLISHPCRGIAGGDYLRMENHHPSACFALGQSENIPISRVNLMPFTQGEASGNLAYPRSTVSARMLRPYRINRSRTGG